MLSKPFGAVIRIVNAAIRFDVDVIRRAIDNQPGNSLAAADDKQHLPVAGRSTYPQQTFEVENGYQVSAQVYQSGEPGARVG